MSELDDQRWVLPEGVTRTAVGVAWIRAGESRRPDRLFDDPYASALVRAARGERPADEPRPARQPSAAGVAMARRIVLRTRFFDDYLTRAAAAGCRQVVLLAAGLDTRAFRLDWPAGTRLFEYDLPEMTAFKEGVLREQGAVPACERVVVPGDLRGPWDRDLAAAGFDPAAPTAWLLEGLLVYLDADEAATLLTGVGALSAPGSRVSLSEGRAPGRIIAENGGSETYRDLTALWKGGLGEPAADWLARAGWHVTRHHRTELERAYGRVRAEEDGAGGDATLGDGGGTSRFDGFVEGERRS